MKKILCVLCVCLLLVGCSKQTEDKSKKNDKQASTPVEEGTLQYLNAARGNGNENGYYRISDMIEKKNNVYSNIRYFDFASKKEIVLCNKPECKHDNDTCNAYISLNENIQPMLFVHGEHLYLFKNDMSSSSVAFGSDGKIDSTGNNESTLEMMDLDGNNHKVITTWGDETLPNDFAYNNRYLYMRMDIAAQKEGSGGKMTYNKESYIQQIDLTSGKQKKILDAADLQLLGVYNNKLLFMKYYYDKDPNSLLDDDGAYLANVQNAKVEIMSYDPVSKEKHAYTKMDSNNIYSFVLNKDTFYFNTSSDATLYALHLKTEKLEEVMQLPTDSKNRSIVDVFQDDVLRLDYYDEKELNASLMKSYFIDLKEKKVKPYSLYTNDLHLPIDVLSQTKDSYFVIYDYTAPEKYIDWADTYQSDIQETFYGLIKKKDYTSNTPKYTRIQEIR